MMAKLGVSSGPIAWEESAQGGSKDRDSSLWNVSDR